MNNLINQQSKPNSKKKALLSLILGIISILLASLWPISETIIEKSFLWQLTDFLRTFLPLYLSQLLNLGLFLMIFIVPVILGITGFILGIKGLKSTKKIIAMVGIILCVIGLLLWLYECLYLYGLSRV